MIYHILLYLALFASPILSAGGTISMRQMRKSNDAVVSWYLNWAILIMTLTVIFFTGQGFGPVVNFDSVSWMFTFGAGFATLSSQILKFKALKLETASLLQKLQPLTTLYSFLFDLFLFQVPYCAIQYAGLTFLFFIYGFQGVKYRFYDLPRQRLAK